MLNAKKMMTAGLWLALLLAAPLAYAQEGAEQAAEAPRGIGLGVLLAGLAAIAIVGLVWLMRERAEKNDDGE